MNDYETQVEGGGSLWDGRYGSAAGRLAGRLGGSLRGEGGRIGGGFKGLRGGVLLLCACCG